MKLNLKKSELAQLSRDNEVLPNELLPQDNVLADELTPQIGGGNNHSSPCHSFADCTTFISCKQF
ncbi:hypothetical protein [Alkalimonas sp.]|uniref:hypothetical protein n=1 Tax=Alkalimonas sp. TaxID=1872453 RepID=UPI00263A8867|nr:hypothetical protein [Alkalimonas sp.]MCC5827234.1 hypothetical protein [Alkalimonas sp.]